MKQRTRAMPDGDEYNSLNMFNYKKNDSDDDTVCDVQLHRIKPPEHFMEAQVQEGDTLQAIALRFYCSISELKRINQIHKDNEIYARRTIKVPITPFSVLTELVPTELNPTAPVALASSSNQNIENNNIDYSINCNEIVLNSSLAPSVVPYTDVETTEQISEDTKLLPSNGPKRETIEAVVVKELTSHGADFGLKWYHLVGCLMVLGVLIPIIYVIFYIDKHEHHPVTQAP